MPSRSGTTLLGVIPGLDPGIHWRLQAFESIQGKSDGADRTMGPGIKCRDDSLRMERSKRPNCANGLLHAAFASPWALRTSSAWENSSPIMTAISRKLSVAPKGQSRAVRNWS